MTNPHTWMISFVRERELLYSMKHIHNFFQKLADHDCRLTSKNELGFAAIWQQYRASAAISSWAGKRSTAFQQTLQAGISETLCHETQLYCQRRPELLTFHIYSMATSELLRGLNCMVTLSPTTGYLLLTIDHERFFNGTPAGLAKYRYWVDLLRITYQSWQSIYTYNFDHMGSPTTHPTWHQVRALQISRITDFQMIAPELVARWGAEQLFDAPAWKVERLHDGGALLIPEPPFFISTAKNCSLDAVTRHVGLALPASSTQ